MPAGYEPPNAVAVEFLDAEGNLIERVELRVIEGVARLAEPLPAGTVRTQVAGTIAWPRELTLLDIDGQRIPAPPL